MAISTPIRHRGARAFGVLGMIRSRPLSADSLRGMVVSLHAAGGAKQWGDTGCRKITCRDDSCTVTSDLRRLSGGLVP